MDSADIASFVIEVTSRHCLIVGYLGRNCKKTETVEKMLRSVRLVSEDLASGNSGELKTISKEGEILRIPTEEDLFSLFRVWPIGRRNPPLSVVVRPEKTTEAHPTTPWEVHSVLESTQEMMTLT